jgi:hypothetical protein
VSYRGVLDGLSERANALPVPVLSGQRLQVELPPPLRFGGAARDALLPSPTGMISHKGDDVRAG